MEHIGWELLRERKDVALGKVISKDANDEETDEFDADGRDVLTALVKVNMDAELPDEKRMSDRDVVARKHSVVEQAGLVVDGSIQRSQQCCSPDMKRQRKFSLDIALRSFATHPILHSTETTWALFALATHPAIQQRLRTEMQTVPTDTPSADELNDLQFLDAVVRETLRVHAAVLFTSRLAMRDDIIPVSKPFVDRYGQTRSEIRFVAYLNCEINTR